MYHPKGNLLRRSGVSQPSHEQSPHREQIKEAIDPWMHCCNKTLYPVLLFSKNALP